jgi:hypothetical protein
MARVAHISPHKAAADGQYGFDAELSLRYGDRRVRRNYSRQVLAGAIGAAVLLLLAGITVTMPELYERIELPTTEEGGGSIPVLMQRTEVSSTLQVRLESSSYRSGDRAINNTMHDAFRLSDPS